MKFLKFLLVFQISIVASVKLDCEDRIVLMGQECFAVSIEIKSKDDRTITEVTGIEDKKRINTLKIDGKNVKYFPKNLREHFENIQAIQITNSSLQEIKEEDLKPFGENLEYLDLRGNEIKKLDKNLFKHNKNLNSLFLDQNEIEIIEKKTLTANLKKLESFDFTMNKCFSGESYHSSEKTQKLLENVEKSCSNLSMEGRMMKKPKKKVKRNVEMRSLQGLVK